MEPENVAIPLLERSGDRQALERREIFVERVTDESVPATVRSAMQAVGEHTHVHVPLLFGDRLLGMLLLVETSSEREFSTCSTPSISSMRRLRTEPAVPITFARFSFAI